jgi:hypothetical protein
VIGVLSDVAALVAALAAMLTAVGTFLTVRQMQRQMQASYRPELTFARVFLKAEPDSTSSSPVPTHWTAQPRYPVTVTYTTLTPAPAWGFFTNLYNVGLGAATSVNVVWNFALEDMIEEVNRVAQRTLTPAFYEYKGERYFLIRRLGRNTLSFGKTKKRSP